MAKLTVAQFAKVVPEWYQEYTQSKHFRPYVELERKLSQKAISQGHLEKGDLLWVAIWGGNQNNVAEQVLLHNTEKEIEEHTRNAIAHLDNPEIALKHVLCINGWGLVYGS